MSDRRTHFLRQASAAPVDLTVRELLAFWDVKVRNFNTVSRIATDLKQAGLKCEPSFEDVAMAETVRIAAKGADQETTQGDTAELSFPQAALLVRDIPSATRDVKSIPPEATLAHAHAEMMAGGYSQLPVITDAGVLVGVVSWERIGHARVCSPEASLADAIDREPNVVKLTDELLRKIPLVYEAGFVLVRDEHGDICGIVTTADLTEQFRLLAEPFFLLGEIERRIRRCIEKKVPQQELSVGSKTFSTANEMTFGDYVRFFRQDNIWTHLGWQIDCRLFTGKLDQIREVRNEIMHFRPDPLTATQRQRLEEFAGWMRHLDPTH